MTEYIVTKGYAATKAALEGKPADAEMMTLEEIVDLITEEEDAAEKAKGGANG